MAETLFNLANVLPLPVWLSMMLFPKARFTQRLVTSPWPFIILGALYAVVLGVALVSGAGGFDLSFDALRGAFGLEWAFLAGWLHYLAFDLFVGVWIFRDAKYWRINPLPFLLLTLFVGPVGLAGYLLLRRRHTGAEAVRVVN